MEFIELGRNERLGKDKQNSKFQLVRGYLNIYCDNGIYNIDKLVTFFRQ